MRQYATEADYVNWAGKERDLRVDDAKLARAGGVIDELLLGVPYDVDTDGMPTRPSQRAAVRAATCAQAQWFVDMGDTTGAGSAMGGASIGSLNLPARAKTGQSVQDTRYAPEAIQTLKVAGMLNRVVNH